MSLALTFYRTATALLEPITPWVLNRRVKRGKEDPARLGERLGRASRARPEGPLVWLHGASVGESLSLLPVIERLKAGRPDAGVLVTSGTTTSAELLAKRLPAGAIHQYVPVDAPGAVKRFLAHWRPDLVVFAESDLWPNLLLGAKAGGAKLALVSARIGEASAGGWARAPGAAKAIFGAFDLILPQDDESSARLKRLGAREDGRLNLKFAGEPLPADAAVLAELRRQIGDRPVMLAASTHPGEDQIVLDAFEDTATERPLLVIVPRHPVRGPEIIALAADQAFDVALRSAGEPITAETDVYVADTLGELGAWFRLARLAVICGSLVDGVGGHNPLEALRLGCPAISGPYVENWKSVYDALVAAGALTLTDAPDEIAAHFDRDVSGIGPRDGEGAEALIARETAALESAVGRLKALIP